MNTKNLLLGIFFSLTVIFASLTISESYKATSTTTITSTKTVTSTVRPPSNTTYGSFTYTPTGQVQVDSVQAIESQAQNGGRDVTFSVTFENIGNSPIYFIGGYVNALSSSVATNSVLQETASPVCPGPIFITTLNHGQNYTVYAPDCSTGFNYRLVHAGSVSVSLSFNWTRNQQETTPFSNSTTISAQFTLA